MKHIELFKDGFDSTVQEKIQPENYPYVGYDIVTGEIVYTLVPEPVTVPADNEIWYTSSDEQVVTPNNTDAFGASIVSNEYNDVKGVITFDGAVTNIGDYAFSGCSSLTSITIPESVTSIGYMVFEGCSSLTAITIPDSVTIIGEGVFYNCSSLTSVTIPNSVRSIEDGTFNCCSSLTSITIPNSVTSIGGLTFEGCTSLTSVTFEGTMDEWNSITKGELWNSNVPAAYVQCSDGQVPL